MPNDSRMLVRKVARYAAVGIFVVLAAALGAMLLVLVVWAFTLGLLPAPAGYAVFALGAGVGGYWGYRHTVEAEWLELED